MARLKAEIAWESPWGSAPGHQGLRVLRADDFLLPQPQPLGKRPDQRGVKGQRTALEDDRGFQLQALGQAAEGLLDNGMEGREGDVLPPPAGVQHRLDICFRKHAAAALATTSCM